MPTKNIERKLLLNAVTVMHPERPSQGRRSEFKTPNDVLQRTSSRREAAFFWMRHIVSRCEAAVILVPMLMQKFFREPFTGVDLAARWTAVALIFSIPLSTAATSLSRVVLLALWLCAGGFHRRMRSIGANLFNGFSLALFLVILVGTTYSISPAEIGSHLGKYSKLLYVPIALSLLDDVRWRHRAITAFLVAMGITLLASMIHVVWPFSWAKSSLEGAVGNHYIFTNHIQQNVMMAAFAMMALHRARSAAEVRELAWPWLGLATLAVINIVFFVGSRTGHLALIVALFVYSGAAVRPRHRLAALAGVAALIALTVALSGNLRDRASLAAREVATRSTDGAQTSSGQRVSFWIGSLTLVQRHPWLGTGTGSYEDAFCTVASSAEWCHHPSNGHPHNQALHLWVENGLPGLLMFMGLLLSPLWIAHRSFAEQRPVIYAFTAIFAVHSMLNASIYHIEGYFFLMLFCCLLGNRDGSVVTKSPQAGNAPDQSPQVPRHGHQQA
jgi:O-antigen ligase